MGNKNAPKHALYAYPPVERLEGIDDAISHLAHNLALLYNYIKANAENLTVDEFSPHAWG